MWSQANLMRAGKTQVRTVSVICTRIEDGHLQCAVTVVVSHLPDILQSLDLRQYDIDPGEIDA